MYFCIFSVIMVETNVLGATTSDGVKKKNLTERNGKIIEFFFDILFPWVSFLAVAYIEMS